MINMRKAMDSAFWDQPISCLQTLHGSAKSIPGEHFPLDAARANRALRIRQLALMGFPLGIIIPPYSHKMLGFFSLQPLLLKQSTSSGLVGQFRPKNLSLCRDAAKQYFMDKSLYSIALCSQLSMVPSSSFFRGT
ncbi:hypothetical protein Dsin_026700 [Dipteronia sinensis]|uniref:Uncharacterized protein n=1 Tax=Dipteronia sinensis TaxID=43782 RepID=A0AAE0DY25_9ROSI|nr:hypothetical protein Dsin_026700 [Dipteronia sinensis]